MAPTSAIDYALPGGDARRREQWCARAARWRTAAVVAVRHLARAGGPSRTWWIATSPLRSGAD